MIHKNPPRIIYPRFINIVGALYLINGLFLLFRSILESIILHKSIFNIVIAVIIVGFGSLLIFVKNQLVYVLSCIVFSLFVFIAIIEILSSSYNGYNIFILIFYSILVIYQISQYQNIYGKNAYTGFIDRLKSYGDSYMRKKEYSDAVEIYNELLSYRINDSIKQEIRSSLNDIHLQLKNRAKI